MITTLSSKGQVVLPRAARSRLHLVSGTKLDCRVDGESIVLTPTHPKRIASRRIRDKSTGLMITQAPPGSDRITDKMVRDLLVDFP